MSQLSTTDCETSRTSISAGPSFEADTLAIFQETAQSNRMFTKPHFVPLDVAVIAYDLIVA